ncbi:MAG TPA: hypothetical protein VGN95_13685 [Pyrinomonadaceae bacterium]|jgi:hypothetical protein|nr:hypothetical protein [Pyrinomonadaceae bacterium]
MDIKEIESAITQLPSTELVEFAKWFEEFQAQAWDEQLEQDVKAGRLDALLREAEQDFEQGQCKPL